MHDDESDRQRTQMENLGQDHEDDQSDEGREHEQVAVGEIDHADDAEHHRVADGDESVDRAERQPIDQLLQEIIHAPIRPPMFPLGTQEACQTCVTSPRPSLDRAARLGRQARRTRPFEAALVAVAQPIRRRSQRQLPRSGRAVERHLARDFSRPRRSDRPCSTWTSLASEGRRAPIYSIQNFSSREFDISDAK